MPTFGFFLLVHSHLSQVGKLMPLEGYKLNFGRWDNTWGMWIEDPWACQLKEMLAVNINRAIKTFVQQELNCSEALEKMIEVGVISCNFSTITGKVLSKGEYPEIWVSVKAGREKRCI